MVKVKDFSLEDIKIICEALNRGHEVHIKLERSNVCIVEEYRKLRAKTPTNKE